MKNLKDKLNEQLVNERHTNTYWVVAGFRGPRDEDMNITITLDDPKDRENFEEWLDELFRAGFVPAWQEAE